MGEADSRSSKSSPSASSSSPGPLPPALGTTKYLVWRPGCDTCRCPCRVPLSLRCMDHWYLDQPPNFVLKIKGPHDLKTTEYRRRVLEHITVQALEEEEFQAQIERIILMCRAFVKGRLPPDSFTQMLRAELDNVGGFAPDLLTPVVSRHLKHLFHLWYILKYGRHGIRQRPDEFPPGGPMDIAKWIIQDYRAGEPLYAASP